MVETILRLADDSARRLIATGHVVPEGYQDVVARGIDAAVPSPDDLRDKLTLRYRVGVVLLGSEMLAEQRRAREERRRVEEIEATARRRADSSSRRGSDSSRRSCGPRRSASGAASRPKKSERRREAEVKERLRGLKLEAAKERLQEAMSPIEEGAQQLHAAVFEAATAIRASLQKHGTSAWRIGAASARAGPLVPPDELAVGPAAGGAAGTSWKAWPADRPGSGSAIPARSTRCSATSSSSATPTPERSPSRTAWARSSCSAAKPMPAGLPLRSAVPAGVVH